MTSPRKPPVPVDGAKVWLAKNLFATPINSIFSLLALLALGSAIYAIIDWALIDASFIGSDRTACLADEQGACWPFIGAKFTQFIYGRYPVVEQWRVNTVFALGALGLILLLIPRVPFKRVNTLFMLVVYPFAAFFLLTGGVAGLVPVPTDDWGGLLITLVVAVTGIVASLPLGILFALGRRSRLPIIRYLCIGFIEFVRGVPLITVLFMASVMLPLFLPEGVNFDKLLRCLIGVALFSAAYMAEVVRGGLQAISRGQYEAARALGLGYWRAMGFVILPQALKHVIPGIVNTFIGLFKDTTLVLIVGLFDLLGIVQFNFTDPNWATPQTLVTGYVFAAFGFWIFCFTMSRYSIFIEKRISRGH